MRLGEASRWAIQLVIGEVTRGWGRPLGWLFKGLLGRLHRDQGGLYPGYPAGNWR